jgi:hypothetical protein
MVSDAEPYLVGFTWDLVMACDGPDWRVGPLWVPRGISLMPRPDGQIRKALDVSDAR